MKGKAVLIYLTLLVAGAIFTTGATAAMYKWTDSEGNVHYTQTPPEEGNATEIAPPPHVSPPATSADGAGSSNGQGDEQQARSKEQEESDAINCKAAKSNLNLYQGSDRYQNTEGNVVVMDEATRQKKIEQTQEQIKRFCH